jgi:hypothetical protein
VDPDRQPEDDLENAITPGYIFGSEPLLINHDFNGQAFIGPDQFVPPSGTDSDSRDISLVPEVTPAGQSHCRNEPGCGSEHDDHHLEFAAAKILHH